MTLYDIFSFSDSVRSWSITICQNYHDNITVGFLFNRQGVSPYSPWFNKRRSYYNVATYNESKNNTVKDLFHHFQFPAIEKLEFVMGGKPHAITLNSYLWDLYRLTEYNNIYPLCTSPPTQSPSLSKNTNENHFDVSSYLTSLPVPLISKSALSSFRSNWIQSWYKNVTEFINYISVDVFPTVEWIGWRLLHNITKGFRNHLLDCILQEEKNDIIWKMNTLMHEFHNNLLTTSSNENHLKKKFHLLSFLANNPFINKIDNQDNISETENNLYMRDNLHPNVTPNLEYFKHLIRRIKHDLEWIEAEKKNP